jgi:serine/threonine-protein phosphatase CPPED1
MRRWPFFGAMYGTFAFLLAMCAGDSAHGDGLFFVQLSDPQFGMYTADSSYLQETANLELAIATANRLKPAFVIVTGDLVNQMGNRDEIEEYVRIAGKLDRSIPLHNVPGNHDVGNTPTPRSIEAYRKRFGPDHYSFRSGSLVGIVLNSSLIASPDKAPEQYEEQERWLRAELEKTRGDRTRHVVIFQHHPWYIDSVDEPDTYSSIPRAQRARYLALFREFGVRTLISGHYHEYVVARDTTFQMITSGPVGEPRGDGRSGLAVVKVTDAGVAHRFHDFGALPSRVVVP